MFFHHTYPIVLWNTFSLVVHRTYIVLSIGIPLFSNKGIPLCRNLIVLWNTLSFVVQATSSLLILNRPLAVACNSSRGYSRDLLTPTSTMGGKSDLQRHFS